MSKTNDFLSDLLDGRCSVEQLDQLLDDKNTSASWYRYNLVSDILKNEAPVATSFEFCCSIAAEIDQQPAIIAAQASSRSKEQNIAGLPQSNSSNKIVAFRRLTGGMAIAASVAFATFFSINQLQSTHLSELEASGLASNNLSVQSNSSKVAVHQELIIPDTLEQTELEVFNDLFLREAKRSEKGAFAAVGGEYVKTIRFSAEQWQQMVQKALLQQAEMKAAQKKAKQNPDEPINSTQE